MPVPISEGGVGGQPLGDLLGDGRFRHQSGSSGPATARHLHIDDHLRQLDELGYDGWVGLEYKPSGSTVDSFGWLPRERRSADR